MASNFYQPSCVNHLSAGITGLCYRSQVTDYKTGIRLRDSPPSVLLTHSLTVYGLPGSLVQFCSCLPGVSLRSWKLKVDPYKTCASDCCCNSWATFASDVSRELPSPSPRLEVFAAIAPGNQQTGLLVAHSTRAPVVRCGERSGLV